MVLTRPSSPVAGLRAVLFLIVLPGSVWPAELTGYVDAGARVVDSSGDTNKHRQYLNLDDGALLFDVQLKYRSGSDEATPLDEITFAASDIGNAPHSATSLRVRRTNAFDFRYQRTESDYFYQDLLIPVDQIDPERSNGGDFHRFNLQRTRDELRLDLDVSHRSTVRLSADQIRRSGRSTTRLDVQREEFDLANPIDERSRTYSATWEYQATDWLIALTERYSESESDTAISLPGFSDGSEPEHPTALELFFLNTPIDVQTWTHQVNVLATPGQRWRVAVQAASSDLDLDYRVDERAQGTDFLGNAFSSSETGAGTIRNTGNTFSIDTQFEAHSRLALLAGMQRRSIDQRAHLLLNGDRTRTDWRFDNQGISLGIHAALTQDLRLNAGWVHESRDASSSISGATGVEPVSSVDTERAGFHVNLSYQRSPSLKVTLSVQDDQLDDPFTRASPSDSRRYRLRASYRVTPRWKLRADATYKKDENETTGWTARTRYHQLRVAYAGATLHASAGYSTRELDRELLQLVVAGFRRTTFDIDYASRSRIRDALVHWQASSRLKFSAQVRDVSITGSFPTRRTDVEFGAYVAMSPARALRLSYRHFDLDEDDLESATTNVWELAMTHRW